jgi:2-polyprenyl-6-methoxyphenol hydroxylase-like FAD-dependent oxidoreductase
MAAREMGGLSLADALALCELLASTDPARYERAALRWLERFIDERLPPLAEVALAASALAELRHGRRAVGVATLKGLLRRV